MDFLVRIEPFQGLAPTSGAIFSFASSLPPSRRRPRMLEPEIRGDAVVDEPLAGLIVIFPGPAPLSRRPHAPCITAAMRLPLRRKEA